MCEGPESQRIGATTPKTLCMYARHYARECVIIYRNYNFKIQDKDQPKLHLQHPQQDQSQVNMNKKLYSFNLACQCTQPSEFHVNSLFQEYFIMPTIDVNYCYPMNCTWKVYNQQLKNRMSRYLMTFHMIMLILDSSLKYYP